MEQTTTKIQRVNSKDLNSLVILYMWDCTEDKAVTFLWTLFSVTGKELWAGALCWMFSLAHHYNSDRPRPQAGLSFIFLSIRNVIGGRAYHRWQSPLFEWGRTGW